MECNTLERKNTSLTTSPFGFSPVLTVGQDCWPLFTAPVWSWASLRQGLPEWEMSRGSEALSTQEEPTQRELVCHIGLFSYLWLCGWKILLSIKYLSTSIQVGGYFHVHKTLFKSQPSNILEGGKANKCAIVHLDDTRHLPTFALIC